MCTWQCVEINGVFYSSMNSASKIIGCTDSVVKQKCLSDDFLNYKFVQFKITYTEKRCNECGKVKLLEEFPTDKRSKDNLSTKCKGCCKIRVDKWCQENPEYSQKQSKEWRKNNHKHVKEYRMQSEVKVRGNKRKKERRKTDIAFKVNAIMSCAINRSLKGMKNRAPWEILVDYTPEELITHLESLFIDGMSWENWGHGDDKWNLDHIIPVCKWDITSNACQAFRDCWALDNLQPLWQTRNFEKGDKPMEPKYLIKPDWVK